MRQSFLAVRQKKGVPLDFTAGDIKTGKIDGVLNSNKAYQFLKNHRFSPEHYKKMEKDLKAWIRQLGKATWFVTLSMAEAQWPDLLRILYKADNPNDELTDEQLLSLEPKIKENLIKKYPVLIVRHFSKRIQWLLSRVIKNENGPLGIVSDYAGGEEAQFLGSLHIHLIIYVQNAPSIEKSNTSDILDFIDKTISCSRLLPDIPGIDIPDSLRNLPQLRQLHRHTDTCYKGNRNKCRFNFPIPPMRKTVLLHPLEVSDTELRHYKQNFSQIMDFMANKKKEKSKLPRGNECLWTFDEFLNKLKTIEGLREITEDEYLKTIASSLKRPTIFLSRAPSEVAINAYCPMILYLWNANIDIQFILNVYEVTRYITSYMSKVNKGMSDLLRNVNKDIEKGNFSSQLDMFKSLGSKFVRATELSAQEIVLLLLSLKSYYSTRKVCFINTSPEDNRAALVKPMAKINELPDDSKQILCSNHQKRYLLRSDELENVCLADWFSLYETYYKNASNKTLPKGVFKLNDGSFIRKLTGKARIIRYVRFSVNKDRENHFRELLLLFHPFRTENDLLFGKKSYELAYHLKKHII